MQTSRIARDGVLPSVVELPDRLIEGFRVFDTIVHAVDRPRTARLICRYLQERAPRQIVTVNVDFLRHAKESPAFRQVINDSALAVMDGRPLVWMARYLGLRNCEQVTGSEVIDICAELSAALGYRIFLLGGEAGLSDLAKRDLEQRYLGINICGAFSPPQADYPFPAHIEAEILARLKDAQPDILFVGFGCPKQDFWIRDHLDGLGIALGVGIGGSFNFVSGRLPRAPLFIQRMGLEWAYRLAHEPRRLYRRYLYHDVPFVFRIVLAELAHRVGLRRGRVLDIVNGRDTQ